MSPKNPPPPPPPPPGRPSKGYAMLLDAAKAAGLTAPAPASAPSAVRSMLAKAERDELEVVPDDDPLMAAAMRKARASLRDFLALARSPRPTMSGFAVKVAIRDCDGAEYFWIHPFTHRGGRFSGQLNNTPRSVSGFKMGDRITFGEGEIVDWMYMEGGKTRGNYTARALLMRAPPAEREAFRKRFGLDPDF